MYRCPVCKEELNKEEKRYVCINNHSFDIAKEGYVHLVNGKHKQQGDNAELVRSRTAFLQSGYYEPLRLKLVDILTNLQLHDVLDIGCGEGYYSNMLCNYAHNYNGIDLSKLALKHAAKQGSTASYAVANLFHLPFFEDSFDGLLSIFTPFDVKETRRVLKEEGYVIRVEPAAHHLKELKEFLYDKATINTIAYLDVDLFTLVDEMEITFPMHIGSQAHCDALLQMTPYAYKTPKKSLEAYQSIGELNVQASFHITIYMKRGCDL